MLWGTGHHSPSLRWMRSYGWIAIVVTMAFLPGVALPAGEDMGTVKLVTGKEIYMAGCVSCHGATGKGQPRELTGFEPPSTFPDFTDCATSTAEPDIQWRAIITNGGPARAFSKIMPAFRDALTQEQIGTVIEYLRGLCTDTSWPRGNLNLPRPLITEKAFPENEVVVGGGFNVRGAPGGNVTTLYERRIGSSGMLEASVPYSYAHASGSTDSAFGDVAIGYKHKLFHSLRSGSIFSVGGEVILPTGNERIGTGGESTVFETFGAYGQILPASTFFQLQTGIELPAHTDKLPRAYYVRTAVGKSFSTGQGFGRIWSPMAEIIADRELESGAITNWDVVPQIQIPLSKRMHIRADIGYRIPINNTAKRPRQLLFYLLWEYVDGSLKQGWK
jgi:mono/diheme cytochrome c family protein